MAVRPVLRSPRRVTPLSSGQPSRLVVGGGGGYTWGVPGGHGHHHGAGADRSGARHQRRLLLAFLLTAGYLVVEVVGALLTRSLALLSDAGHMLTDVAALGMALAAVQAANRSGWRGGPGGRTFGLYRLEILAAFVNALLLVAVAGYVMVVAVNRLSGAPDIRAGPMLVVATLGLVVNLAAFALLRPGSRESLNVEGAYLEVVADALGSMGAMLAAVVLGLTGWRWVDPAVALAIGLFILPRAWRLGGRAVRVLLQAAPPHIDPDQVRGDLAALDGVIDVHDLHVWTLTSDMESASAHLMVAVGTDAHGVLDEARQLLQDRYAIAHATLQVEPADHSGCDAVEW
jgi:cobalt-zinc-cadmium efflux system protein